MKLLRSLLFPFAIIYDLVTTIRNFLFEINFFKQKIILLLRMILKIKNLDLFKNSKIKN